MKIATCSLNYYGQNSIASCKAAGTNVRKANVDFVGFTEVRSVKMIEGLEQGLGAGYNLKGDHKESPIAHKKKGWKLIDFMVKKATDGEAGITPNLFLVIAVYQKRSNPKKVIEVIATHLVPLSQDGKKRPDYAHRKKMWDKHWALLKEVVHDGLALGHSIFVIGDFNNRWAAKSIIKQIHPKAKWIHRKGLDWIFAVEGTTKIRRLGITRKIKTGSDHGAYWRRVILA